MTRSLLKWLLGLLVVANVAVWAGWHWRDRLVAMGVLAPVPVQRIDLDPEQLPPIVEPGPQLQRFEVEPGPPPADAAESRATPDVENPLPPAASETVAAPLACVVAGPFESREAAVEAEQRLAASGATVELLEESEIAPAAYLVYVEPAASGDAAWHVLRELRTQSVDDAYVIPSGPLENGVSIGVFTEEDRANTRRDRVAALGYTVNVQTRENVTYRVRAVDVLPDSLGSLPHVPCDAEEDG